MQQRYLQDEIKEITARETDYPAGLGLVDNPPEKIYYRGCLPNSQEACLAIVGTRRASDYGKDIAFSFSKQLTQAGLTIVSGLALGIDSASHQGALAGGGKTIAFLGTGLAEKTIYPQSNLNLAKEIVKNNGCLISEYPAEYPGSKHTFPRRNRLIAGLSLGVLVVEAKIPSGALITAHFAKKLGKPIFAIPSSIRSANSRGCHLLLKQGAILAERPEDILEKLGLQQNSLFNKRTDQKESNQTAQKIIDLLNEEACHIDKIIEKTGLGSSEVSSALTLLELEDKVKNIGGNVFTLMR